MNIAKVTKAHFLTVLFLGTTLGGVGQGYAGFQVGDTKVAQTMPATVQANTQMDGTPLPPEQKTRSLQIYNDRYVPDSVRKKYNLDDSWYAKGQLDNPSVEVTPVNPAVEINAVEPAPATLHARPAPQVIVDSWRGRKGENIRDVLQRWSTRGGTNLMWASADTPVLQKEFTYVGKFQDAVNELIRVEGGAKIHSQYRSEGFDPVMMTPASTVTTNTVPVPHDDKAQADKEMMEATANPLAQIFQPEKPKNEKPETRWFALSGAPLAEVIQVWADDAGVQLVWQSEKNFAVKESISQVGHFEDAVFRALDQYGSDEIRPVGEMYRDAQSGKQTLLVRTEVN